MKKLLTAVLALMMALSLCTAALSEEDENTVQLDKNTTTGETEVSLTVSIVDDYTVVIPASVTIDPETRTGEGTITLKAGYVLGGEAQTLKVKLTNAKNGVLSEKNTYISPTVTIGGESVKGYANFKLKTEDDVDVCPYSIECHSVCLGSKFVASSSSTMTQNTMDNLVFIEATSTESNTADKTCTICYYVPTLPKAGTYTDTLTFSIITE